MPMKIKLALQRPAKKAVEHWEDAKLEPANFLHSKVAKLRCSQRYSVYQYFSDTAEFHTEV